MVAAALFLGDKSCVRFFLQPPPWLPSVAEKGCSIWRPTSSMPKSIQQMIVYVGTVAIQPMASTRTKGSVKLQMLRKRDVCREYESGT